MLCCSERGEGGVGDQEEGGRRRRTHDIKSEGRVDKYAWKPLGCAEEGGRETPRYVLTGKRKGQLHAKDDRRKGGERQHGNENRTRSEPAEDSSF